MNKRFAHRTLCLLQAGLIMTLLCAPFTRIAQAAPPPPSTEADSASTEPGHSANCALLDDPAARSMMSGALETALLYACGRPDEAGTVAGTPMPSAPTALGDDVLVNNPAGEITSMTQNGSVIAYNENNGVLCAAYNDSYHGFVQSIGYTGFSSSTNGGATWVDHGATTGGSGASYGYPTLAWRRSNNHFYLATLYSNGLGLWDLGTGCTVATWVGMIHTGSDDKEMLIADNNPASPYYGRLYTAWTDFTDGHIYLTRSSDGGQIWSAPVDISGHNQTNGVWLTVDPTNGNLYAAWTHWDTFPDGPIDVEMARSTDGGANWTPLANPMSNKVNPRDATASTLCSRPALKGNIRYFPYPQVSADQDGNLHIVYSYDPDGYDSGDVVNVYYRRSTDQGTSWENEKRVNDNWGYTDQFSPALALGENGLIGIFWYDRRLDATNNLLYDRYMAISRDGGLTFESNQRISDASSPVVLDPYLATCFHGDYDSAAAGDGYFYTAWGDDRRGDGDVWSDSRPYFWEQLSGSLYDASTRYGLPGGYAAAVHDPTGLTLSAYADTRGQYTMPFPSQSPVTVTGQAYGYLPNTVTAVASQGGLQADIPLSPAAFWNVQGQVTDARTGYPVYAHLSVSGAPFDPPAPYHETWSDGQTGDYALPNLAAAIPYTLTIEAQGYLPLVYNLGTLNSHLTNLSFALQPDLASCTAPGYAWQEIFADGFETGSFGPNWSTSVSAEGRVIVAATYPYAGTYSALLDDSVANTTLSLAALQLTQDLSSVDNVSLDFWRRGFGNEEHPEDGIFISDDSGANWYWVAPLQETSAGFTNEALDIAAAAAAHGLALNDHFMIKFQFYDDYPIPNDGFAFDEVRLRTCQPAAGISLQPETNQSETCPCEEQTRTLYFANHTGLEDEILLNAETSPGVSIIEMPASLGIIPHGGVAPFEVRLKIDPGVSPNTTLLVTLTAHLASQPATLGTATLLLRPTLLESPWQWGENAPLAVFYRAAGATLDDYAYIIGGQNADALGHTARFRPGAGWQTLDDKPTPAANIDAAELNGKIYIAGGYNGGNLLTAFEELDPSQTAGSQWATLPASLPVATGGGAMAAACGKIYFMGGSITGDISTNTAYVYDPALASPTWQAIATMPQTQRYASAVAARGLIFTIGDWDTGTRVQVYDCATSTWLTGYPQLNHGRQAPGSAVLQNRYILAYGGGGTMSFSGINSVEILDLDNLAAGWQAGPPMLQGHAGPGGGLAAGKLVVVGGSDSNTPATNTTETIAICPGCECGVGLQKEISAEQVISGEEATYTVVIRAPQWVTATLDLVDPLPPGADFAGSVAATYGTAWYDPISNAIRWTRPTGAYSSVGAGTLLETFNNTWSTNGTGLAYSPQNGTVRYVHESSGANINAIAYPPPHPLLHSFNLSDINPGWPTSQNWRSGAGYDPVSGHYFLADYGGGGTRNDNFIETDSAGQIINAWETNGASNDSYDSATISNIVDIAVVPGTLPRYFVTALFDGGTVYEINVRKAGQFIPNTWGLVRTCTVAGLGDNAGIDYDAQNDVLYHSSWDNETVVVTDLNCNVLQTFTCSIGGLGHNSGITFIEGQWPPEAWVVDSTHNQTARCQAVGHQPAPEVITVTYTVEATAPVGDLVVNQARLNCAAPGCADPQARSILLLTTTDVSASLHRALDELGYPYDTLRATNWSGIDFTPYDLVIIAMDGGSLSEASIQKIRTDVIDQGKRAILFGGTATTTFVNSVNQYLVENNVGSYNWALTASPHFTLATPTHPLAQGLPLSRDFTNNNTRYYQLRATDPALEIIAQNGDSHPSFFRKSYPSGGDLLWFIHSPQGSYWSNANDFNLLKRLVANALAQPGQFSASAAFQVAPAPELTWAQEIYINGSYVGLAADGPFTAALNDVVQIVDRLDYVGLAPLFVELSDDWGSAPATLAGQMHTHGVFVNGGWHVTLLPGETARLVRTLDIIAAGPITIASTIHPAGMPAQQRTASLEPPLLAKDGPAAAQTNDTIVYTLTLQSHDPLFGALYLTDTLPAGLEYLGDLTASYGEARYEAGSNTIYWSNTPASELTRGHLGGAAPFQTAPAPQEFPANGPLSVQSASPGLPLPQAITATWFDAAPLPAGTVRYGHAQCPGEPNRFYIISGVIGGSTTAVWRYDADLDQWSALADFPIRVEGPSAVCYQGKIYATGGLTSHFYIYDIVQDFWETGPTMPRPAWGAAMGAWDGKLYLAGGDDDFFIGGQSSEVDIYTIATGVWQSNGAPMIVAASAPGWVQVNEYLYVVGGWGDAVTANINATQRYNMTQNSWEIGPTFASARADFTLAASGQYIYAIGGDANGGGFFDSTALVERLDYTAWPGGTWTDIADPLPAALSAYSGGFCTTAHSGGEIWSVGGLTSGFTYAASNQYRPSEACAQIPTSVTITFKARVTASGAFVITNTTALDFRGTPLTASTTLDMRLKVYLPLILRNTSR